MTTPLRFSGDWMSFDEQFGFYRRFGATARELLGVRPGLRVLEVGCGSGAFTRVMAEAMAAGGGEIVAVDRDPELLARAREETRVPPGSALRVRFEDGDAYRLPFKDDEFDLVVSMFLLCIVPEPLVALREMRRVARAGAIIGSASCFCKSGIFPTFEGMHEFGGVERLRELQERFRFSYRTAVRNPGLNLPNGRDLDVWADYARAGLEDLRIDGVLTVASPGDARYTDEDGVAFVEQRQRIELGLLDRLSAEQRATLAADGFGAEDLAELRELLERKYAWLLADRARIRRGMELVSEPAVIIRGRVPAEG